MEFKGASILSISQFERDDIDRIFRVADRMEPYAQRQKITRVEHPNADQLWQCIQSPRR